MEHILVVGFWIVLIILLLTMLGMFIFYRFFTKEEVQTSNDSYWETGHDCPNCGRFLPWSEDCKRCGYPFCGDSEGVALWRINQKTDELLRELKGNQKKE